MNAPSDGPVLLALIQLAETDRARGSELAPLVLSLVDQLALGKLRVVVDRATDREDPVAEAEAELSTATHDRAALERVLGEPAVLAITARAGRVRIGAGLRFANSDLTGRSPRTLHAVVPREASELVVAWLRDCAARTDILHGGVTLFASEAEALVEATLVGVDISPDHRARWSYEAFRRADLFTRARSRLYWLTVLGPALAARAGGAVAARAAGADAADEVAGSLFVRATADVADVLDPRFATRTASLRRWLWPHTVQNPLDADFEPAVVVLATAGRLVIESPQLGRRILLASLPALAKGQQVRVAFPGAGDTLVIQPDETRTLTFADDGRLLHDIRSRP